MFFFFFSQVSESSFATCLARWVPYLLGMKREAGKMGGNDVNFRSFCWRYCLFFLWKFSILFCMQPSQLPARVHRYTRAIVRSDSAWYSTSPAALRQREVIQRRVRWRWPGEQYAFLAVPHADRALHSHNVSGVGRGNAALPKSFYARLPVLYLLSTHDIPNPPRNKKQTICVIM